MRKKFGLTRVEAASRIAMEQDMFGSVELPTYVPPIFDANPGTMDYRYWDRFRIPRHVVDRYTFLARSVYKNESYWGRSTTSNPIFIYPFPSGRMKIYRPLSPDTDKK